MLECSEMRMIERRELRTTSCNWKLNSLNSDICWLVLELKVKNSILGWDLNPGLQLNMLAFQALSYPGQVPIHNRISLLMLSSLTSGQTIFAVYVVWMHAFPNPGMTVNGHSRVCECMPPRDILQQRLSVLMSQRITHHQSVCPRAGLSVQTQAPRLQVCPKIGLPLQTKGWIGAVASGCFPHTTLSLASEQTLKDL